MGAIGLFCSVLSGRGIPSQPRAFPEAKLKLSSSIVGMVSSSSMTGRRSVVSRTAGIKEILHVCGTRQVGGRKRRRSSGGPTTVQGGPP